MRKNFLHSIIKDVVNRNSQIKIIKNNAHNSLDFCEIFNKDHPFSIVSEVKFKSPSQGRVYPGCMSVLDIVGSYLEAGASAISILTEPFYFGGNIKWIHEIRQHYPRVAILQKDFIISKKQIDQGLCYGANAVLLMASLLPYNQLKTLFDYAVCHGLTPVVEVHNEIELETVLALNPKVIGINNRNLKNLKIDLNVSRNLIKKIPKECYVLCESGIENKGQLKEFSALGFDGFLIGTHLMRYSNPGRSLNDLLSGEKNEC